jgi:hypothetical protein
LISAFGDDAKKLRDADLLTVSKGPNDINILRKNGVEILRTFECKDELKEGDQLGVVMDSVEGRDVARIYTLDEYPKHADRKTVENIRSRIRELRS